MTLWRLVAVLCLSLSLLSLSADVNNKNCGTCGTTCAATETCSDGVCK